MTFFCAPLTPVSKLMKTQTIRRIWGTLVISLFGVSLFGVTAKATMIDVGTHELLPDTAGQSYNVTLAIANGADTVQSAL